MALYIYKPEDREYLSQHNLKCFDYYWDKLEVARDMNCASVIGAMRKAYRETRSARKTGKLFGITNHTVLNHMKRIGEEIRPRGGDNGRRSPRFHGKECPRCGETERYVSTTHCVACNRERNRARYWAQRVT